MLNWNWSRKTRLMIVAAIGVAMILFGISEGVFHYWVSIKVANEVCFILMLVAAAVIFSGRGKTGSKETDQSKDEKKTPPEN